MQDKEQKPLISCALTYQKASERHERINASLWPEYIEFNGSGFSSAVKLNSLYGISIGEYRVTAKSPDGDIVLSMMGHLYEDFALQFVRAYNEVVFNESLMSETIHFEAPGIYVSPENAAGKAVFRICETSLVILPDDHELVRLPFCVIAKTEKFPYRLSVIDRLGRTYIIQKMGYKTDPFIKAYEGRIATLIKQTREKLSEIAPCDDTLAKLMVEGLFVNVSDICAVNPRFADALDKKLSSSGIAAEYGYLKSISDSIAICIKRGLMGDLTGEAIHILAPVFDKNVMILESFGDSAAATYVFHLAREGGATKQQWDSILPRFNNGMLAVNFRREPVALSDEALSNPENERYLMALRRVPELRELRGLFIGRAIHGGFESWKKTIDSLIK